MNPCPLFAPPLCRASWLRVALSKSVSPACSRSYSVRPSPAGSVVITQPGTSNDDRLHYSVVVLEPFERLPSWPSKAGSRRRGPPICPEWPWHPFEDRKPVAIRGVGRFSSRLCMLACARRHGLEVCPIVLKRSSWRKPRSRTSYFATTVVREAAGRKCTRVSCTAMLESWPCREAKANHHYPAWRLNGHSLLRALTVTGLAASLPPPR